MKTGEWKTYKVFNSREEASEMDELLRENGIKTHIEYEGRVNIGHNRDPIYETFTLKMPVEDIDKAERIREDIADKETEEVDPDYYLISFSNEELKELISESDKWPKYDYVLARKLLGQRGHPVNTSDLQRIKAQRREELARPEKESRYVIWGGYMGIFLGGFPALVVGYYLINQIKTQEDGRQLKKFDLEDRIAGRNMLLAGLASTIIWVVLWLFYFTDIGWLIRNNFSF